MATPVPVIDASLGTGPGTGADADPGPSTEGSPEASTDASPEASPDPSPEASPEASPGILLARLLQLASPALPIGAYSYSSGLETALDQGRVRDVDSAFDWIADAVELVLGRFDAAVVAAACRIAAAAAGPSGAETAAGKVAEPTGGNAAGKAGVTAMGNDDGAIAGKAPAEEATQDACDADADLADLADLDRLVLASRETAESRLEAEQTGYSLSAWLADVPGCAAATRPPPTTGPAVDGSAATGPVAYGRAAARLGLDPVTAATAWLWGFAENQVMVLIKAMPLGQIAGQRLLWRLGPVVARAGAAAARLPPDRWSNACPGFAIASMAHERQYSRLFRS